MLKWLSVILFSLLFNNLFSQTDSVFWFAAPAITYDPNSNHTNRPIIIRITAFEKPATVSITEPANPSFSSITLNVAANSSVSYDLTNQIDKIESKPANQVLNYGLQITSSALVTAYYEENSQFNPEMFVLKGNNALGTNFFIPAQNIMNNWGFYALPPVIPNSSFDIVATEDNTVVSITPANDIVGHNAGSTFTITLNKGQVYSAAATSRDAANHLMGSVVMSNKKIAITIKDDSIGGAGYSGCLDLAGDQIVPTSLVGTKYITLPGFLNDPIGKPTDHLFLLATQDNTSITINGTFRTLINKGQTYHDSSMNEIKYVVTSLPTYALHLSGFGCEVGHAMLPQIECTGSQKVAFTRSNSNNLYMNILVPNGYENKFTFNGDANFIAANLFDTVPYTNGLWKYARVLVNTTQLPVGAAAIVKNSGIEFHLSVIHGDGSGGARYGYFSDFNKLNVTATSNAVNGAICAKSDLKFFTNFHNALAVNCNWIGPNGFIDTASNPIITSITTNGSGTYTLTATKFSCSAVSVPLTILVNPTPTPTLTTNAPICSGKDLNINATYTGASFSWTGPNNFVSNNTNIIIQNAATLLSGYYKVITTANNCSSTDSISVVINETPSASITVINNNACLQQNIQLKSGVSANNTSFNWTLPNGSNISTPNINITTANYNDSGKYILTASVGACTAKDSAFIKVKPNPQVQFVALAEVCSNVAPFVLSANEITGIAGNAGIFSGAGVSANGLFNPAAIGDGLSTIRFTYIANNGCSTFKEQTITVNPTPVITTENEKSVHTGGSVVLNTQITGIYSSLIWDDASNTLSSKTAESPTASPKKETLYTITVSTNKNCTATNFVWVRIVNSLFIPNVFSPNGDGKNDTWLVEDKTNEMYLRINIFDRYGKMVKTIFGNKLEWDGMYNGQPLPVATYYYVLTITQNNASENKSGWIQLLR